MLRLAALALVLAAVAALPAAGLAKETRHARAALPLKGVLVPGKSLAGVRLGDSPQQVLSTWGDNYRVCDGCSLPTWFFAFDHPDAAHRGVGTGVVFRGNRAVAVFTLGTPLGGRPPTGCSSARRPTGPATSTPLCAGTRASATAP
jgi:hypothetical protein